MSHQYAGSAPSLVYWTAAREKWVTIFQSLLYIQTGISTAGIA